MYKVQINTYHRTTYCYFHIPLHYCAIILLKYIHFSSKIADAVSNFCYAGDKSIVSKSYCMLNFVYIL